MSTAGRTPFELLPAIDLRDGRVVRLAQGDFERETVFGDDPVAVASGFADAGAPWLHVVDLDGARLGTPRQLETVAAIAEAVGEPTRIEVSGGLRSEGAVAAALALAHRVVLGTAALRDPAMIERLIARNGTDRVAIAIDVRDGRAVGEGWQAGAAGLPPEEAIDRLAATGATVFEVTAIDRDGLLGGPDLALYERLVAVDRGRIIASGGIATTEDLSELRGVGCAGAIIGRAIYEGRLDLAAAIEAIARS
jgi:phosphoribosylformimino-5-aminoimidazole carboxamide ribotide isomerase